MRSRLSEGVTTLEELKNVHISAPGLSRAVNVTATPQAVTALCEQHQIGISTIEPLPQGGTRVVLNTADQAENFRRRMKGKLIDGPVVRSSMHVARQSAPYS